MKYFILEAVKNRCVDSFFLWIFLINSLAMEMMLRPRLDTMPGSSRPLECHVGICNELLEFLSDAGEHFFGHIEISSAWTYLKSSLNVREATLTLYFVSSLPNFM